MRGSIIQQIFRVVNETHSPATKKNKEWQEKLPIVVLRAEEIMYSKANSEAEYIDPETLWDRLNEAIDTIIRRDDSSESGNFLQPCIEAALNLGCIAVKASRSQRQSNPRSYLHPKAQEPPLVLPRISNNTRNEQVPKLTSTCPNSTNLNPTHSKPESIRHMMHCNNLTTPAKFPFLHEYFSPHSYNHSLPLRADTSLSFSSVYPLYYGTQCRGEIPQNSNSDNTIFVGIPVIQSTPEPIRTGILQNVVTNERLEDNSIRRVEADYKKATESECDLSLRLGLHTDPCTVSSNSQEEREFNGFSVEANEEFAFFPCDTTDQNVEASFRKRKGEFSSNDVEDRQFYMQSKFSSDQLTGRMKRPGL